MCLYCCNVSCTNQNTAGTIHRPGFLNTSLCKAVASSCFHCSSPLIRPTLRMANQSAFFASFLSYTGKMPPLVHQSAHDLLSVEARQTVQKPSLLHVLLKWLDGRVMPFSRSKLADVTCRTLRLLKSENKSTQHG